MTLPLLLCLSIGASTVGASATAFVGARKPFYVLKPLTTLLIIALALVMQPVVSPTYYTLVLVGLVFSLAGDVFLMLPKDRFVPGLASFLIAHLLYIAAFWGHAGGVSFGPAAVGLLACAGALVAVLLPRVGPLKIPVLVYSLAILGMGLSALGQWQTQPDTRTAAALAGALLFVVSDSALAIDRFLRPFRWAQPVILGTYFPAQALIAWSIALPGA